ncbi:hypothetical protein [Butyrivibrio hungatei]|uniref:TadE-like protein n=1 Tax=Butyrivibrio hungatei TaxID=185008 RepID=A0A1D9NXY4_9FIRM|nr:hypothetical protein [Butyrivibrio hungatei]AOZ95102.1 hypothetical protein bhn_I0066 [Butyrivibrio hungatei]
MRKFKGYMTLEASLIVPMVICVFVVLIFFTYYLYGRCVLSQDSYILAFRASINKTAEFKEDPEGYVAAKMDQVLGNKYFGSEKPTVHTRVNGKEIIVTGSNTVRTKAMGRYFLKPKTGWDYIAAGKAKKLDQIKHMRRVKRLKDIAQRSVG